MASTSTRLDVYVGVSSGSFLAGRARGRARHGGDLPHLHHRRRGADPLSVPRPSWRPAFFEFASRAREIPGTLLAWLMDRLANPLETDWSELLGRFGSLIPTGIFDGRAVEEFLRKVFEELGRTNDFRKLSNKLYIVAVDLDTGETVRFGDEQHRHIPISRAVQASAALPGLYPPVEIEGRHYVDGALRRTLHASVAMEDGCDLVLGLNPLVPFDQGLAARRGKRANQSLVDGGLPTVLSQTFRTMLKSRMQVGLDKYQREYPASDLVLFEPGSDDAKMFFTNIFSYQSRQHLTEHAYQATRADLVTRKRELAPILARAGLKLRDDVLSDSSRTLLSGLEQKRPRRTSVTARLRHALDDLDVALTTRR
jgi:predicted acylesterase/phospholipase RssA